MTCKKNPLAMDTSRENVRRNSAREQKAGRNQGRKGPKEGVPRDQE